MLDWRRSNWEAHEALVAKLKAVLRRAGFPVVLSKPFDRRTPSHQCGTARMGTDPATSVVDIFCRAHDHPNLFVVDASFLPTSAAVNPALTIAAQALRVGRPHHPAGSRGMKPVALVTGGQQGIGLGIAAGARRRGLRGGAGRRAAPRTTDAVRAALGALGPDARYFRHDLQEVDGVPALLDRIEAELGPVTTLVSNAGVPAKVRGDMLDLALDSFDFVLGVNLRGAFFLAQEAARRMLTLAAGRPTARSSS